MAEVPGIGKKRREWLCQAWAEHGALRDIIQFLYNHLLSTLYAQRLYRDLGPQAPALLQANHYRLVEAVPMVGFGAADQIARQQGTPLGAPTRLHAEIEAALLILEAIGMREMRRFALLVASSSLLLIVFNELVRRGALTSWVAALLSIWISTDYAALGLFLVGYLILYFQLSGAHGQLASTYRELEEAHAGLATAASQIERLTRLTERQRLARDLHDTLSQGLVGVKLQLEAVDALPGDHGYEQAQEIVRQAMTRVQETLLEARSVIDELRTGSATAHTCAEAAEVIIQRFTTATGIPCQRDLAALTALPAALHEHGLRVLGEGLANIAQHAQARQVWVRASQEGDWLKVEVQDDGRGFEPTAVIPPAGHYGLLGLRERARLVGGRVEIASASGAGTSLRFWLPFQAENGWVEPGRGSGSSLTRGETA